MQVVVELLPLALVNISFSCLHLAIPRFGLSKNVTRSLTLIVDAIAKGTSGSFALNAEHPSIRTRQCTWHEQRQQCICMSCFRASSGPAEFWRTASIRLWMIMIHSQHCKRLACWDWNARCYGWPDGILFAWMVWTLPSKYDETNAESACIGQAMIDFRARMVRQRFLASAASRMGSTCWMPPE